MRTAAAIEDSRAYASRAHRGIGSSRQWPFRRPHNAASIAPFVVAEQSKSFGNFDVDARKSILP
jgi:hypothetical protein